MCFFAGSSGVGVAVGWVGWISEVLDFEKIRVWIAFSSIKYATSRRSAFDVNSTMKRIEKVNVAREVYRLGVFCSALRCITVSLAFHIYSSVITG